MGENDIVVKKTLTYLPRRAPINIEFQELKYTVPQGRKGAKLILRSISGSFQSGQLHAILGPSGAGKSTLLNILAGYKCSDATGSILINGEQRDVKEFRKISRYIMQEDLLQPHLTVIDLMLVAADLKLGNETRREEKMIAIDEILELLRLSKAKNTSTNMLSGGEKKRLSIALELINNPPVIFLDEPTTGLDDLSCSQCISLLKLLAEGGRTVICSIHTPSAKLFSVFDNVYIVNDGQCVYQGYGPDVVPFLSNIGLVCPLHYNPADFIIEVCCGEYGDFQDKMVSAIDNGRNQSMCKEKTKSFEDIYPDTDSQIQTISDNIYCDTTIKAFTSHQSWWHQFTVLLMRMWLQMWRDKGYLLLKTVLHIIIGVIVGTIYLGMGKDGSKTIFNFGFYFTCIIFFMYVPMMPVLLSFPREIQYVKREHFNRWYGLRAYFVAFSVSQVPVHLLLGTLYVCLVYVLTDQPMEFDRFLMFYSVCIITGFISESFGLMISSVLNITNGMFVAPVATVPLMLLAVYGFGSGWDSIPILIKIAMYFSYLRYSLEGLIHAMLTNRTKLPCPEEEEFCVYNDLKFFVKEMGMENTVYWVDILGLTCSFLIFRGIGFYLLKQRLAPNKTFVALQYIGRLVKSQLSR